MNPRNEIIVNGRFLDRPTTGVQRFAAGICGAVDGLLAEQHPLVADLRISVVRPNKAPGSFPFSHLKERRIGRLSGHTWEQFELPFHAKTAPLLNLCNTSPLLGRNNLTVVHDANVWLMPDNYSRTFRAIYHLLLPLGIRRSRMWVTVSKYSADQLLNRHIADRPPNAIVGNGSDHMHGLDVRRSKFASAALPRPFVFALGSRSRAKNIDLVRSIAGNLSASGISTVIAGDANARIFTAQAATAENNVIDVGRVNDEDLAYLLQNCLCLLFPSHFEGFGIPPIEAMAMGAPVISSSTASMPEVLGDAALYCAPHDRSAWIAAVLRMAGDAELRSELIERGRAQATKHTWKASALRLLELARQMLPPTASHP
jgi:glycosyltransferase involved in cell wall biosynthesis